MEQWLTGDQQKEIPITDEDRRVHESYIKSLGISRRFSYEDKTNNDQEVDINDVKLKGLKSNVQMEITAMLRNTLGDPYEEPASDSCSTSMSTPEVIVSSNPSSDYNSSRELDNEGFMGFARFLRNDNPIHMIADSFTDLKISETQAQTKKKSEEFPALGMTYPRGRGRGRGRGKPKPPSAENFAASFSVKNKIAIACEDTLYSRNVKNETSKAYENTDYGSIVKTKTYVPYENIDYSRNAAITSLLNKNNCTIDTHFSMEEYSSNDTTEEITEGGVSTDEYVKDWLENRMGNQTKKNFQTSKAPVSDLYKFLTDDGDFEYVPCVEES